MKSDIFFKKCKALVMCLVIAIVIIMISVPATAGDDNTEKVTLRLKWIKDILSGGPIVAQEKGFFKERGLDVEVLPGGFDLDPVKLVTAGSDTFGVTGAETLQLAIAKGIPIVAIGIEYQKSPVIFIAKKKTGITRPQDFVGKRVGVKPGTDVGTIYAALMKKLGIDRSKITEIPIKWSPAPFFIDEIDVLPGWIVNQPLVARKKGVDFNLIKIEDYGINFYGNCYFTSRRTLEERPDLVEKFMAGIVDGWFYVVRHKEESIDIAMKHGSKLDRNHQIEEYDAALPLFASENGRFGWMTEERWKETHDTLIEIGLLKKPLDLNTVYTMKPLMEVYK